MKTPIAVLCLGLLASLATASESLPLPLASADVRGWSKIAGGVRIQIESPECVIESVKISAFGREIEIPPEEFAKLKGVRYSEVSVIHEGGYEALGGHTISFTLRWQDMFGGDPFKGDSMQEEIVSILVPEKAPVRIKKKRVNVDGR
jgi:hypothetical protein